LKLLKAVEYAIRRGIDLAGSAAGALDVLRSYAPEFEHLRALLPGGIRADSGEMPSEVKSNMDAELSAGVKIEARAQVPQAFGSLHKIVLEETAVLLQKALRGELRPGTATAALHGSDAPFTIRDPAVTPIYQTTAYEFESLTQLEEFLLDQDKGYIYSRWGNPTVTEAQDRLTALTGAGASLLFSSGMAAISSVLMTLLDSGDRLVALRHLYGGTVSLLDKILPRLGIEVELIGFDDIGNLGKKLGNAKAFYFESISNPVLRVPDVKSIVDACRGAGVISVCDNTFATPYNLRVIEHGVDLEIHSGSKFLSGHSDLIIGAACGSCDIISKVNLTMRYMGTNTGPFQAFLLSRGLRTLPLRMGRHNANATAFARRLQDISGVRKVLYPHLDSHPDCANARILAGGGGMVTFEVEGGLDAARRVVGRLRLARSLTTLGSPETSFCVPVLSSHYGLSPEVLAEAGVTEGMIRVSVGLEDAQDIINDFEQALAPVK
jgi:cystathionine beta-lyase/cystathionine gamma-synthase